MEDGHLPMETTCGGTEAPLPDRAGVGDGDGVAEDEDEDMVAVKTKMSLPVAQWPSRKLGVSTCISPRAAIRRDRIGGAPLT